MLYGGIAVTPGRSGVPGALAAQGLSMTNTIGDTPLIGGTATYTIAVSNDGGYPGQNGGRAYNVDIIDTLPAGVTFSSATAGDSGAAVSPSSDVLVGGRHVLTFSNLTDIVKNQTYTLKLTVSLAAVTVPGTTLTNDAAVRASTTPRGASVATTPATTATDTSTAQPFTLTHQAVQSTGVNQATGDCATNRVYHYNLVATNNGVQASSGVVVTDTLPYGTVYCAANTNNTAPTTVTYNTDGTTTLTFALGTLGAAASTTPPLAVYVGIPYTYPTTTPDGSPIGGAAATPGSIIPDTTSFAAQAGMVGTYQGTQYSTGTRPATVTAKYATIAKGGSLGTVGQDSLITYTLTVAASAYYNATAVVVTDTLPNGQQYVEGSASLVPTTIDKPTGDPVPGGTPPPTVTATRTDGQTIITWNVEPTNVTASKSYVITFQAKVRTTYSNNTQPPVVSGDGFTNTVALSYLAVDTLTNGRTVAGADNASAAQQTTLPTFVKAVTTVEKPTFTPAPNPAPPTEGTVAADQKSATAAVGDIVTFRLTFTAAGDVDSRDIVATDVLPPNYRYVAGSSRYSGSFTGTVNGAAQGTNPEPTCDSNNCQVNGALLNYALTGTGNNIVPKGQSIAITLKAQVVADGASTNLGKLFGDNTAGIAYSARDTVSLTTIRPTLQITKTNTANGGQLGTNALSYTVTVKNTGVATAYRIPSLTDDLPNDICYTGTTSTSGGASAPTGLSGGDPAPCLSAYGETLTIGMPTTLAPGASAAITYSARVSPAPVVGTTERNTATVASYASQPTGATPDVFGSYGPATGSSTVAIGNDVLTKTGAITSAANGGGVVTIGDTLTYTLGYTLQPNTTVINAELRECLPLGFHYIAGSYVQVTNTLPTPGTVAAAPTANQNGTANCPANQEQVTLRIGDQSNATASAVGLSFTVRATVTGLTQPLAPNPALQVFDNATAVSSTRTDGAANENWFYLFSATAQNLTGPLVQVASKSAPNNGTTNDVYVPRLTLGLTLIAPAGSVGHTPADGTTVVPFGSTVTYRIVVANPNVANGKGATAFDVRALLDTLNAGNPGLTYTAAAVSSAADTGCAATTGAGATANGQAITIPTPAGGIAAGGAFYVCLQAQVSEATPSTALPNGVVFATELDGANVAKLGYYTQPSATNTDRRGYAAPTTPDVTVRTPDVITFPAPANATYGDPPLALGAGSSGGRPIDYTTSTATICAIVASGGTSQAQILKAGVCTITAAQRGENLAAPVTQRFTIAKAPLTVKVLDQTQVFGDTAPIPCTLQSGSPSGFKYSDTVSSLGGTLACSGTATASSPPGTYLLIPSGYTSDNYTVIYVKAKLTITARPIVTTFDTRTQTTIAGTTTTMVASIPTTAYAGIKPGGYIQFYLNGGLLASVQIGADGKARYTFKPTFSPNTYETEVRFLSASSRFVSAGTVMGTMAITK